MYQKMQKRRVPFKGLLDFKGLVADVPRLAQNALERNQLALDAPALERRYAAVHALKHDLSSLQQQRNAFAKKAKGQEAVDKEEGRRLRDDIDTKSSELGIAEDELLAMALRAPNWTDPEAPLGPDNVIVRTFNTKPSYAGFTPKPHDDLLEGLDLVSFEAGRSASGARGYMLKNTAVQLHYALLAHATDVATRNGFTAMTCPSLVRRAAAEGCGFSPRDVDHRTRDMYVVDEEMCLSATGEIPLASVHASSQLSISAMPHLLCGVSPCYRPEAGNSGRNARGLYRVHEFTKVELFVVCLPSESREMLTRLVGVQEQILAPLGLHCRVLDMPPAELGAAAFRKFDIEAFWPAREEPWGELSSASNCTDFQSRRLLIRYSDNEGLHFVHTLNATAMALPRTLAAMCEHHQTVDGNIRIPDVLVPYMGGRTHMR